VPGRGAAPHGRQDGRAATKPTTPSVTSGDADDDRTPSRVDARDAALRFSDNTAANLLFEQVGGPAGRRGSIARSTARATRGT